MSDLIDRSERALAVDSSLPKSQRLEEMLKAFSGLHLSELDDDVRDELEEGFNKVNLVLSRYDLQTSDDYRLLSDADIDEALAAATTTARQAIENELLRIVVALEGQEQKLPVAAIEETRQHRELMIPVLIDTIREAAADAEAGNLDMNAHFFAMFLLSEFHSEAGFQAIMKAVSLPGELPFDLFGDCITEVLARILAQFCGDRPEKLDELIANRRLNEYVRWEAAQTYILLVRDGRMQRDDAVGRLRDHLRQGIIQGDDEIISALVCELTRFGAREALDEIREAFEKGMVDTFTIGYETAKTGLEGGDAELRKSIGHCPPTGIEDTIAELRTWASFREEEQREPPRTSVPLPKTGPNRGILAPPSTAIPAPSTALPTERRVGRNNPCPCGSGKKYKKCCLRSELVL